MGRLLIELQYFGTISWYLTSLRYKSIVVEAHEHFEKSTYRNRCYIASPQGRLRLTIPLLHGRNQRSKYAEVKIDYSHNWQKVHWNSLCFCYRNSPYFEYYEDRLAPFFHDRQQRLFDFNRRLMFLMLELLGLDLKPEFTSLYERNPASDIVDFRSRIIPNQSQQETKPFPLVYRQVFQERTGFLADLSIIDLLFNEGPRAGEVLAATAG